MGIARRWSSWAWLSVAIFFVVAFAHCGSSSSPNLIDPPFDAGADDAGYGDSGPRLYVAQGVLQGLPLTGTATLLLNGANALPTVDGPFVFPAILANGEAYAVTVSDVPPGYSCGVMFGTGTITHADASGIVVNCSPAAATLSALTISAGAIAPTFAAATLAYTAGPVIVNGMFEPASTTVTATASDPNATITVNGVATQSGIASAPITLKTGPNPISVVVTAADKTTTQTYAIAASGVVNDYLKASNTRANGFFGDSVALSADGTTLAVGSQLESSDATGINGLQTDTSANQSGAVYVFVRVGGVWSQQAYIKASNTAANTFFGDAVALSADGNTLAVGSDNEASDATGIGGSQTDTSAAGAGAVYVFSRTGTTWTQAAYIKASNTAAHAVFGASVALSTDGNTLAVGAYNESSDATGVNGTQTDMSLPGAGAVYVFSRAGAAWSQQAYLKASNVGAGQFGFSVALSSDGNTLAVGANAEGSAATGIGGGQTYDPSFVSSGAVFVFSRAGTTWIEQAYVKSSNTRANAQFGNAVALSTDGNTLAVGSLGETSGSVGINGNETDTSSVGAGAAYLFTRATTTWSQQAYMKASNTVTSAAFGRSVTLAGDGNTLVVGSYMEPSHATGINGTQTDTSDNAAGAAYVFTRAATTWTQKDYVKASNTAAQLFFGTSAALSRDGSTLVVGATGESSDALGVNGNQADTSAALAGAVYVF